MSYNKSSFGILPKKHTNACISRNKFQNNVIFNTPDRNPNTRCDADTIGIKHQRMWDTKPNEFYYGLKNNKTAVFKNIPTCDEGYPNKVINSLCPSGYKSNGSQKINTNGSQKINSNGSQKINTTCNTYYKKCIKVPEYNFKFTKHNNDISEWTKDNLQKYNSDLYYENEQYSYKNVNDTVTDAINNINSTENNI